LTIIRSSSVKAVRVLPQLDVALHVHFLRHPVVGAGGEVLVPGPAVLERHELVDVGRAVDDALVLHADATEAIVHSLLFDLDLAGRFAGRIRRFHGLRQDAGRAGAARLRGGERASLRQGRGEFIFEAQPW